MTEKRLDETSLQSWKEIASYLQRDEKTARRWEKLEGLPIHRHQHLARSSVYAYPSELDAWRASREPVTDPTRPIWLRPVTAFASIIVIAMALMMAGSVPQVGVAAAQAAGDSGIVLRQIWSVEGRMDATGQVSPDGLFLSQMDDTSNLAIRDLTTGEFRQLTTEGDWKESNRFPFYSRWSWDGKRLAYAWVIMPYQKDLKMIVELRVTDATGENTRVLLRGENYLIPVGWFPDGESILAMNLTQGRASEIIRISVADGTITYLEKTVDSTTGPARVCLSPNGKHIAIGSQDGENSGDNNIFVIPAEGGAETAVVSGPYDDRLLAWTPDGRSILFSSNRSGMRSPSAYTLSLLHGKSGIIFRYTPLQYLLNSPWRLAL